MLPWKNHLKNLEKKYVLKDKLQATKWTQLTTWASNTNECFTHLHNLRGNLPRSSKFVSPGASCCCLGDSNPVWKVSQVRQRWVAFLEDTEQEPAESGAAVTQLETALQRDRLWIWKVENTQICHVINSLIFQCSMENPAFANQWLTTGILNSSNMYVRRKEILK